REGYLGCKAADASAARATRSAWLLERSGAVQESPARRLDSSDRRGVPGSVGTPRRGPRRIRGQGRRDGPEGGVAVVPGRGRGSWLLRKGDAPGLMTDLDSRILRPFPHSFVCGADTGNSQPPASPTGSGLREGATTRGGGAGRCTLSKTENLP